jgi:hypothetical protein
MPESSTSEDSFLKSRDPNGPERGRNVTKPLRSGRLVNAGDRSY